jgi:HK97 family phage major capsid protein/HK97 family phage prohead protease
MENRQKLGKLARSIAIERTGEGDQEVFTASLSSEEPYGRYFGVEILDHGEKSIDLSRARDGLPLLWGHDGHTRGTVVGRVENLRVQDKRLRGDLRFFSTADAQDVKTIVAEGHREMSIGYTVERMRLESTDAKSQQATYRVTRWQPMEASIVAVPADATVGVGRAAEDGADTVIENALEPEPAKPDVAPAPTPEPVSTRQAEAGNPTKVKIMDQSQAAAGPDTSVADIINLGEKFAALGGDKVAQSFLRSGRKDLNEFQAELLQAVGTKAGEAKPALAGMNEREKSRFSVTRLIHALAAPHDSAARAAAAFEFEASEASLKAQGRGLRAGAQATIPVDVLYHGQRDLIVATSTMGGFTVGTDLQGASFIDILRNKTQLIQAGATVLSDLSGVIAIPTKAASATAYWVAESGSPTEGNITFGQLTMTPKTVGAYVDFSRKLTLQSSIAVEQMVRNDLIDQLAVAIDLAGLAGAGTGSEPSGILTSTSVGTATAGANGGAPTWQLMVDLETLVANGNADVGRLSYFFNTRTRGKLKAVTKSTSAVAGFIWEGGATPVNGYAAQVTNQLSNTLTKGTSTAICSAAIFGNFADLVIGQWGGLDLMVDPYTGSTAGTMRVVALQDIDIMIRRNASFAYIKDLLTT